MRKPILVTGGAGFIGSHLVDELVRRGDTVRVLDDLSTGRPENLASASAAGRVELTVGSVAEHDLLASLLQGCSHVYHLAATVGVGRVTANPAEGLRNNVQGVQTLFAAMASCQIQPRVLLFSSSEVYGKSEAVPLREDGDLLLGPSDIPRWSYASGKIVGEFLALAEHRQRGVPVTVVRCFNTCGPRQLPTYGMVIPRFLDQAMLDEPLTVYGDGQQTRCFSFVDDVVQGVLALADQPEALGEIVNIGSDRETSILELAEHVRACVGSTSPIRKIPYHEVYGEKFQDVRRRVPDLEKIRRLIGYPTPTDLCTLLQRTFEDRRAAGGPDPVRPAKMPPPATAPAAR